MPLTTGKNPISLVSTVEKSFPLRAKMTELCFLPYQAAEIYGTKTEISCFGRSEISISTGRHAILLIFAVDACRRNLPQKLAADACRRNLPQKLAAETCRRNLPQKRFLFTGLSVSGKQPAGYCRRSPRPVRQIRCRSEKAGRPERLFPSFPL